MQPDERYRSVSDLMNFNTLLDHEKAIICEKVAKKELSVPKNNKGQPNNLPNPYQMDGSLVKKRPINGQ